MAETHEGLIFIADDRAFKLKKATNAALLDFPRESGGPKRVNGKRRREHARRRGDTRASETARVRRTC